MESRKIFLVGGEDDEVGSVFYFQEDGQCSITFQYRGKEIKESASDYFEAFAKVRLSLEKENLIPFCYAASLTVYPSGMCRDMGAGLKAYRLKKGVKASKGDLVDIFDTGADVIPSSVKNQKEYFEDWIGLGKFPWWKFWN